MSFFLSKLANSLEVLDSCQKPKHGTPIYTRTCNRWLGKYIAALAKELLITPTHLTIASFVFSVFSFLFFLMYPGSYLIVSGGSFLILFAYALDSADGQLARLTKSGSPVGEWLDHSTDALKQTLFHGTVQFIFFVHYQKENFILVIPIFFISVQLTVFTSNLLKEKLFKLNSLTSNLTDHRSTDNVSFIKDILFFFTDYGILCMLFFFIPFPNIFVFLYVLCFIINALSGSLMLVSSYLRLKKIV